MIVMKRDGREDQYTKTKIHTAISKAIAEVTNGAGDFKKLIDIRKELNIHPLIDIRLLEKTEGDRDISFPRRLIEFAENAL